jgi:predicted dinucleotide-binding enzyme
MRIGILGTGVVGATIGGKLAALGHQVRMGSRTAHNEKAAAWAAAAGANASQGTFADAAAFGEIVFNCTSGNGSLDALSAAGADNLHGKVLVDVANPLEFSGGALRLSVANDDSLGERIQRAFPDARVVKALNTVNAVLMVDPGRLPGEHSLFVAGNDADAKAKVTEILRDWFGWKSIVDLGDITAARGMEAYLLLWIRMMQAFGTPSFNVQVVRA